MTETAKKATTPKKPRASAAKTTTPNGNGAAPTNGAAPKTAAPKKKSTTAKATPISVSREEIAMLAHRFWVERGGQHGSHEDDWIRAERELMGRAS
jgi:Protein of unknown function (DUF2934)